MKTLPGGLVVYETADWGARAPLYSPFATTRPTNAVVHHMDWPNRPRRIIDAPSGKPSVTRWRVLSHDESNRTTRLELEPLTGRSHQLRVHLLALGHPIVGDTLYGNEATTGAPRMLLHAQTLEVQHPVSRETLRFVSAAPF